MAMFDTCIREILGLNLEWVTGYPNRSLHALHQYHK